MTLFQGFLLAVIAALWGFIGFLALVSPFNYGATAFEWFLFATLFVYAPLVLELLFRMLDANKVEE